MDRVDVAVVGGGPGGAIAARRLARAGLDTRLIERDRPPRYKTCGGGLVGRARRWLDVDLAAVTESECRSAEMRFLDDGSRYRITAERPVVTMTMRAELDRLLVERAVREGAGLRAPCAARGLLRESDGVRLETDAGPLVARYVIAADGAAGPVARWAGWGRSRAVAAALESEIEVAPDVLARCAGRAIFDFGLIPGGYAWVFPKRRHLSVGCLTTRPGRRDLRRWLDAYLVRLGLEPSRREDHGFVIPLAPRAPDLARDRVLLTGDSAGLADPITAEGISFAAASGQLAAEAILAAWAEPRQVALNYQRALRRTILGELAAARPVARLLYRHPRAARRLFRRAGYPLCRAMGAVLAGQRGYRELASSPGSYLRLARRLTAGGVRPYQLIR